jgi:hypothetical protein
MLLRSRNSLPRNRVAVPVNDIHVPNFRFRNVRVDVFVIDLLSGLRGRNLDTAAWLIRSTWQSGQNRNLNVVRPIQLAEVPDAAPRISIAVYFEPVAVAVVVKISVNWLCTKTTHVSEWMINSNLPQRLPRTYESHQRELVDRSFKLEDAAIEESTN